MKLFKHLVAAAAALVLLSSCSMLGGSTKDPAATGNSTGSALKDLYTILKNTGLIDLGNLGNLIDLGTILTGANALANAGNAYADQFADALIAGSQNLINSSNVAGVLAGLKGLANIETSNIQRSAATALAGNPTSLNNDSPGVASALSALNAIFSAL